MTVNNSYQTNLYFERIVDDEDADLDIDDDDELNSDDDNVEPSSEDPEPPQKEKKKRRIWLWGGIILVLLLIITGICYWLFFDDFGKQEISLNEKVSDLKTTGPAVYILFPEDEIMAILYDKEGKRHNVVLKIVLLTRDNRIKYALESNSAIVLSEFLELVEKQSYEYLLTFSGKQRLREKMLHHIKNTLPNYGPAIEKVLIVKFLMD